MDVVRKCEECGKYHTFSKCPKCRKKVYRLDPTKPEQRCKKCGAVLHKEGKYLCNGKKDGEKCGALVPAPRFNTWLVVWLSLYLKHNWKRIADYAACVLVFAIAGLLLWLFASWFYKVATEYPLKPTPTPQGEYMAERILKVE